MRHGTHVGANKNAAQSVSDGDRENAPHLLSSLLYSRRVDGVIQPRSSIGPFLEDAMPPSPQSPIATLAHGLERVLFNPGVQWLQDPRSQVYSFTTWLEKIVPVKNFAFERLTSFLPSSRDQDLYVVAQREGRKYAGSTSSMSGLLSQLYYLISGDKPVDTSNLSKSFRTQPQTFTPGQRGAASVILNYRNGVYLIDSAGDAVPGLSGKNVLTWMGTLLEKFLTHSPSEFLRLTRSSDDPTAMAEGPKREAYRYAKSDKFILRSQLDCFDHRLPGTGVFDIKTRAVMTIRHDLLNFEENSGYQIRTVQGLVESFEKEYYDLIRSAFLKYSFQARIGNMDGVFVAYHNTKRIFGFQYIPLSEMDARLFGESAVGDAVFEKCLLLLEVVLEEATRELPYQSIRLTAEKLEGDNNLRVFLEPAEWDEELHGSKPVIQLDVSTKSYIGEMAASGSNAVDRSNFPWTVLWTVSKSALEPHILRRNLTATRRRAFYPLYLPDGVGMRDMEKVWHELQFNPVAPVEVPFKAELFRPPPRSVQVLRRLSRKGRDCLESTTRKLEGRPKLVLGLPNDAEEVAQFVALAHGDAGGVAHLASSGGRSDSDAVDSPTAIGPSTEPRVSEGMHGQDRSGVEVANVVSDNQGATHSGVVPPITELGTADPSTVDTGDRSSRIKEPTRRPEVVPLETPLALETNAGDSDDFISEKTLAHLEEMLSEDQRRIVEDQDGLSAGARSRLLSRLVHHRPGAGSKSVQLIKDLRRHLRDADKMDKPSPVVQEDRTRHAA
ncbi:mitochondrial protein Pet127-domain-containing protein [Lactifluus subvellereus]|nr:mitochondrial protein Pet127-domain-containing protein [Lactifluus subvellereus]